MHNGGHPTKPLIIDGHGDTAQRFLDERWNFDDALGHGMLNLATARAGGLSAEFFAIWVDPTEHAGSFNQRALELIDASTSRFAATRANSLYASVRPSSIERIVKADSGSASVLRAGMPLRTASIDYGSSTSAASAT